jgi:hypothetical protein
MPEQPRRIATIQKRDLQIRRRENTYSPFNTGKFIDPSMVIMEHFPEGVSKDHIFI